MAQPIAFPGAEGFGQFTTGGRGGKVFVITTLDDDGPGSFRKAVQAKGPRIIVFAVSGTIHLLSKLDIKGNATIAGQTAPGDGICLADYPVSLSGDNIIIRYLRFRMGDKNQKGGMVNGNGSDDALGASRRNNIIIDHCSISWSTDEAFSVYNGDSTTLQWNLIAEPLNYSYHFETGDKDYEHHGYGGIWGGKHLSAHHNLFAHCNSRNPRFDGIRNIKEENVDFRNNVIYNWDRMK
jgi:pectate lyase